MIARTGYFVDANLLVLLVVGRTQKSQVGKHRRLQQFTENDFDKLVRMVGVGSQILLTPNTLTEASNLLAYGSEALRSRYLAGLAYLIGIAKEVVVSSKDVTIIPEFRRLGLTDSVLIKVASKETPLITIDLMLYLAVATRDPDAVINFNHPLD